MQIGVFVKHINNIMANSEGPDETARYKPFYLDLDCLQRYEYM